MEKGLILGGLLGLNHIHEKAPKTPSENDILVGLAENDSVSHNACINGLISEKKATILVSLFLTFVPFLQYLCYHLYEHGWYPFWAFLIFGTISLGLVGLAGNIVGTNVNLRMKRRRRLVLSVLLMSIIYIASELWPFWLVELDVFVFVHCLVIIQDVLCILFLFFLFFLHSSIKYYKEREADAIRTADKEGSLDEA